MPKCRCAYLQVSPFACSGAMYAAVPRITPTPVNIAGEVNVGIAYLWQLADALEMRVQDLLPADDHPLIKRDS